LIDEPEEFRPTARLPGPERRQQLLEAARLAFANTGFHETSMNDVAKVAGVTKPVLYQRFESKRDLYRAVLEDISQRLQATVFETAAAATTPREQVEAGFSAYIDFVQEDPDGFKSRKIKRSASLRCFMIRQVRTILCRCLTLLRTASPSSRSGTFPGHPQSNASTGAFA